MIKANAFSVKQTNDLKYTVLHIITNLFDENSSLNNIAGYGNSMIKEMAPIILSRLVEDSEELQKAAMDANTIIRLTKILKEIHDSSAIVIDSIEDAELLSIKNKNPFSSAKSEIYFEVNADLIENQLFIHHKASLLAIAASCSLREECRKQVVDNSLLPIEPL